jgi:RND family efflux transporter MFP subunit
MNYIVPPTNEVRQPESRQTTPLVDQAVARQRRRAAWRLAAGAIFFVLVLVGFGTWTHIARSNGAEAALQTRQTAVPLVRFVQVRANNAPRVVDLAGNMQAFDAATLYARATGYIAKRFVDIGSRVHKGDVLAVIAAPDLDQQLVQARAQLLQMQAALQQSIAQRSLAHVTNQRTSRLVTEGWASRQQGDQDRTTFRTQTAGVSVAQANVAAQAAQVDRLIELTGFEKVLAPFDGVITARDIDVGNLVTADAATGTPLFSISHNDVLRVQVYVPQEDVFGLKNGQDATITVPQLPGKTFHGRVARNAGSLGATTRTLLAEVDVDNADNALSPGLYGIVHIEEPRHNPVISVPSQAIIFDKTGLSVDVVEGDHIATRHLDIAADNGATLDVRAGLRDGDKVILSPPVDATDGTKVRTS